MWDIRKEEGLGGGILPRGGIMAFLVYCSSTFTCRVVGFPDGISVSLSVDFSIPAVKYQ